ncbi:MAG TPA: hypothetical protein VLT36_08045 [Candidatus Dormibacteraeota bacterium]|nr:hypothetical protein [Candidatus Dormibacteraeota bacterium]
MKAVFGIIGLFGLLLTSGCYVEPAGGTYTGYYGEYPYGTYGHTEYYPYRYHYRHYYYHPYDRDHYYYRY